MRGFSFRGFSSKEQRTAEGWRTAKEREKRTSREASGKGTRGAARAAEGRRAASVSNEFRISLADGRRDYFKEIRNYLIRREKVINSGETN